jgi:hypothetical protein
VLDPFPASNPLENMRLFVVPVRRDQSQDRFPNNFLRRVSEKSLRADIPARDDAG